MSSPGNSLHYKECYKYNKYVKENTPINKVVTVSDVATSITFLASEAASMITGSSIIIDGGWTAK